MAPNELTIRNDMDIMTLGKVLAASGYFQGSTDAAQAVVKVLYGQELGVGPIASMMGIHIIQGKPSPSAGLIASIIKRSGKYNYRVVEHTDKACTIEFFEQGQSCGVSTFTLDDAKTAGALTGKNAHTWRAYGRNMLFARALTNGARWYCPDVFGGPVYMPEELDALVDGETGDVITTPQPALPAPTDEAYRDPYHDRLIARIYALMDKEQALTGELSPEESLDLQAATTAQLETIGKAIADRVKGIEAKQAAAVEAAAIAETDGELFPTT